MPGWVDVGQVTDYLDDGLEPGSVRTAYVRALDSNGQAGPPAGPVVVSLPRLALYTFEGDAVGGNPSGWGSPVGGGEWEVASDPDAVGGRALSHSWSGSIDARARIRWAGQFRRGEVIARMRLPDVESDIGARLWLGESGALTDVTGVVVSAGTGSSRLLVTDNDGAGEWDDLLSTGEPFDPGSWVILRVVKDDDRVFVRVWEDPLRDGGVEPSQWIEVPLTYGMSVGTVALGGGGNATADVLYDWVGISTDPDQAAPRATESVTFGPPTGVEAVGAGPNAAALSWVPNPFAEGVQIEQDGEIVATVVGSEVTSHIVHGLEPATTYTFRLRSIRTPS